MLMLDMEMPNKCDECKLRHMGLAWCNPAGKSTSHHPSGKPMDQTKRPNWCPLHPMLASKWIVYEVANTEEEQPIAWECENCGDVVDCMYNYCHTCGAEMTNANVI